MELQGAVMPAPDEIRQELLAAMREIIRYVVMTLHAVPDPDARYPRLGEAAQPMFIREAKKPTATTPPWVRAGSPHARDITQMEVVMPWLAWLRREEGEDAIRRIWAWSLGVIGLAHRPARGVQRITVMNRIDRSVVRIIRQFANADIPVEHIEEPYQGVSYALIFERTNPTSSGEIQLMRRSTLVVKACGNAAGYLRDGTHKIERAEKKILDQM